MGDKVRKSHDSRADGPVVNWLIPALSALVGVLIGSAGSVTVAIIQGRATSRRERNRLSVEMALAEFGAHRDDAARAEEDSWVQPPSSYLLFYHGFLEHLHEGTLTPEALAELRKQQKDIHEAAREVTEAINPGLDLDDHLPRPE